jgi:hypothetical protein
MRIQFSGLMAVFLSAPGGWETRIAGDFCRKFFDEDFVDDDGSSGRTAHTRSVYQYYYSCTPAHSWSMGDALNCFLYAKLMARFSRGKHHATTISATLLGI